MLHRRFLHRPSPGEVVISMRPVSVFANGPSCEIERLRAALRGPWHQAARAVMVLMSLHGITTAQIAALLDLGRAEELRGELSTARAGLAACGRSAPSSVPLTRPDAGHRRALDQPLAAAALRAELLERRFSRITLVGLHCTLMESLLHSGSCRRLM
jgi:hypothetical protein